VVVPLLAVGAMALAVAAYLFAPWKLVVDQEVNEPLPGLARGTDRASSMHDPTPAPRVVAQGRFVSHEHQTSGRVKALELGDGSRVLRIENLETSNGPDLRVWVTDSEVLTGRAGWFVFDDGRHVDLGPLRGNLGNQNYAVPAGVDLDQLRAVSIWCRRFHVSFGAAELGSQP
jgi:electron transfer DM13